LAPFSKSGGLIELEKGLSKSACVL
jgi:hypothetical protein